MVNSKKGNTYPVYQEMSADMLTPVSAYLKISHGKDYSFMLESIEGGEQISRYSFIGAGKYLKNYLQYEYIYCYNYHYSILIIENNGYFNY